MWHTVCMMGPRTISFNDNKSMMQFDKGPSIYYVSKGLRGWVKKVAFFCWRSVLYLLTTYKWVGRQVRKGSKICIRNMWMVPKSISIYLSWVIKNKKAFNPFVQLPCFFSVQFLRHLPWSDFRHQGLRTPV